MKFCFTWVFSFLTCCLAISQNIPEHTSLGYFVDLDNKLIEQYTDIFYSPKKKLDVNYTVGKTFTEGYYYDLQGNKINGLIKCSESNTFFQFQSYSYGADKIVRPNFCSAFVLGLDSFVVIQDFDIQRPVGAFHRNKREFVQVIDSIGDLIFYKHIKTTNQDIITTYIVNSKQDPTFVSFSKGPNYFKETALSIFKSFDPLVKKINNGKCYDKQIPGMIKLEKYKYYYDNDKLIYFNAAWDEIGSVKTASYYGKIVSIEDSLFNIEYYTKSGNKIYDGTYYSFIPAKKHGKFHFYYPSGNVRKEITFFHNNIVDVTEFYDNGGIHKKYSYYKEKIKYNAIFDRNEVALLDSLGNGTEILYDSIQQREITYIYKDHFLSTASFLGKKGGINYQTCEKNAKFKSTKKIQSIVKKDISYKQNQLQNDVQGYALVKCIIEPTGLCSSFEIIKSLDDSFDKEITVCFNKFKEKKFWKPASINKIPVRQEIVVPISFTINEYTRQPSNNYFYNNSWMQYNNTMYNSPKLPPPNYSYPAYR